MSLSVCVCGCVSDVILDLVIARLCAESVVLMNQHCSRRRPNDHRDSLLSMLVKTWLSVMQDVPVPHPGWVDAACRHAKHATPSRPSSQKFFLKARSQGKMVENVNLVVVKATTADPPSTGSLGSKLMGYSDSS